MGGLVSGCVGGVSTGKLSVCEDVGGSVSVGDFIGLFH